jgi:hypothetical protein
MMSLRAVLLLLAVAACRERPDRLAARRADTALPVSAPSNAPAPRIEPAPAPSVEPPSAERAALALVEAWSAALDGHHVERLPPLYAESVRFYGRRLSRDAVVAAKTSALSKQTRFRQQLVTTPNLERAGTDTLNVTFVKRSGEPDEQRDVPAKLVLALAPTGTWQIIEEADAPSETPSSCQDQASQLVNALPEVQRAVRDAQTAADASGGRARFGGIGPIEEPSGAFSASLGIHTDERFETYVAYEVDRQGRLSVAVFGSELTLSPASLRSVAKACKR